jgi:hypothetical protein
MGKAGRIACIITPMALTIASLICFLCVMVGQLGNNNKAPSTSLGTDLYFFKVRSPPQCPLQSANSPQADTSNFTTDPQSILDKAKNEGDKFNINNDLLDALTGAASSKELKDFYQVGLWSYCEGEKKDGVEKITYCSSSKTQFWFDPIEVWGLKNTSVQNVLGDDLQKGLNTYKKVAGWMNWAFIIATILTAAEFVVGFFAIFSRWGSLVTTILSTVRIPNLSALWCHTNLHRPPRSSLSPPPQPQPASTVSLPASSTPHSNPTTSTPQWVTRCCRSCGWASPSASPRVCSGRSACAAARARARIRRWLWRRRRILMSVWVVRRLDSRDISCRTSRSLSPVDMGRVGRLMSLTAVRSKA